MMEEPNNSESHVLVLPSHDIGTKLENFFIALRSGELSDIVFYLSLLENHLPLFLNPCDFEDEVLNDGLSFPNENNLNELNEVNVVKDIVTNCREKTSQFYRVNYCNDFLNTLITNIRKKLMVKIATSVESSTVSAVNHHQRHLISLIDLLGSFSNLIMEFQSINMSLPTQIMIVVPIHNSRIKETIQEIYKNFKQDKNLDSIQNSILQQQQNQLPSTTSNVTIASLDNLLIQISSFSATISRYYIFLNNVLLLPFYNFEKYLYENNIHRNTVSSKQLQPLSSNTSLIPTDTINSVNKNDLVISIFYPPELKQQMLKICEEPSLASSSHLRELDAYFISFEYKYLSLAVAEAIHYTNLLHIERNVYIPQNVEDIFFLFRKVAERSISLQNESILFALGHKIIEMLDPRLCIENDNIQQILNASSNPENIHYLTNNNGRNIVLDEFLNIYLIIAYKAGFHLCSKRELIRLPYLQSKGPSQSSYDNVSVNISSSSTDGSPNKTPPVSKSGVNNGLHQMFSSSSHALVTTSSTSKAQANAAPSSKKSSSALDLGAWFVEALTNELDEDPEADAVVISYNNDTDASHNNQSNIRLKLVDMCVYVSTLATCVVSIESLLNLYHSAAITVTQSSVTTPVPPRGNINRNGASTMSANITSSSKPVSTSSLSIVTSEMLRCQTCYKDALLCALEELCQSFFSSTFERHITAFMSMSFTIDGETMDRYVAEEKLSSFFKLQLFGSVSFSSISTSIKTSAATASSTNVSLSNSSHKNVVSITSANEISDLQDIKDRLTSYSYRFVLQILAESIVKCLFDECLKTSYNEWGAILMQHEIRNIIRYFEEAYSSYLIPISHADESITNSISYGLDARLKNVFAVRQVFSPLYWFGTLLTLDQPGNIRRYTVPLSWADSVHKATSHTQKSAIKNNISNNRDDDKEIKIAQSESLMKLMLSCRSDFSFDAIQKIKVSFQ